MANTEDNVALIDLDGTTADFDGAMAVELEKLRAPEEPPLTIYRPAPPHIVARQRLIKRIPGFWRNLPRLKLGFEVLEILREFQFQLMVLTKGPGASEAWGEKVDWTRANIPDAGITIIDNADSGPLKSLSYGRILVDDWPAYYLPWLEVRPRGTVISVAHPWNEGEHHPRVVRYDGTNLDAIREAIRKSRLRPSRMGMPAVSVDSR